jgi:hypothetical protein
MITNDGQLEIEEQESGTYVFPNSKLYVPSWAIFMYPDGRAELYTARHPKTGALLGKPKDLGIPASLAAGIPQKTRKVGRDGPHPVLKTGLTLKG